MNDETGVAVVPVTEAVELGVITASSPAQLVERATAAANALASVIESRKLYSTISGKRFVRCEGWTTLAAMLGVTPHEISVTEQDGAFTATVELRRLTDGQPVGRASAECGSLDESLWASRPRYARRSMALTRATAKACRLCFSWVMALAGFEVTPAEEIPPDDEKPAKPKRAQMERPDFTQPPAALTPDPPLPDGTGAEMPKAWRKTWPFGSLKGRELHTLTSDELMAQAAWARKSGRGLDLVETIDEILASREGL
jgi:hypothetical protein